MENMLIVQRRVHTTLDRLVSMLTVMQMRLRVHSRICKFGSCHSAGQKGRGDWVVSKFPFLMVGLKVVPVHAEARTIKERRGRDLFLTAPLTLCWDGRWYKEITIASLSRSEIDQIKVGC